MTFKFILSPDKIEPYPCGKRQVNDEVTLVDKIRYALEPDSPELLREYLCSPKELTIDKKRQWLLCQFDLLLETSADECLPIHWRMLCFDHIHRPLLAFKRIAHSQENQAHVNKLFGELRIMGHYLFH